MPRTRCLRVEMMSEEVIASLQIAFEGIGSRATQVGDNSVGREVHVIAIVSRPL